MLALLPVDGKNGLEHDYKLRLRPFFLQSTIDSFRVIELGWLAGVMSLYSRNGE